MTTESPKPAPAAPPPAAAGAGGPKKPADKPVLAAKAKGYSARYSFVGFVVTLFLIYQAVRLPWTMWEWYTPHLPLKITVVDKTVPHGNYREHSALFWTLNHLRTSPDGLGGHSEWIDSRDYIGWHPRRADGLHQPFGQNLQDIHVYGKDVLYLADAYGVYRDDVVPLAGNETYAENEPDYSPVVFGGYDEKEVDVIEKHVADGGNLVGEFAVFSDPTVGAARTRLEHLFKTHWTGWVTRRFNELSDKLEVPGWARRHYEKQYGRKWDFTGPGWIVAHEDTRIDILEEPDAIATDGLRLEVLKPDDPLMQGVYTNVPYNFWADIVELETDAELLAHYRWKITDKGASQLIKLGIPHVTIPAVIRAGGGPRAPRKPLIIYFCGDWADNDVSRGPFNAYGWESYKQLWRLSEHYPDVRAFFYEFYVPLMRNVVQHVPYRGTVELDRTPIDWKQWREPVE